MGHEAKCEPVKTWLSKNWEEIKGRKQVESKFIVKVDLGLLLARVSKIKVVARLRIFANVTLIFITDLTIVDVRPGARCVAANL